VKLTPSDADWVARLRLLMPDGVPPVLIQRKDGTVRRAATLSANAGLSREKAAALLGEKG
jgi:hypothetical protein